MKTGILGLAMLVAPTLLCAESIRCGSQLIEQGSTSADLLQYCGEPTQKTSNGTVHGLTGNTYTPSGVVDQSTGDLNVETWIYDFGPNQLMERIRLENGIVVQLESLGYGHNQP